MTKLDGVKAGDEVLVRMRVVAVHVRHDLFTVVPASSGGVGVLVSLDDIAPDRLTPARPRETEPASD